MFIKVSILFVQILLPILLVAQSNIIQGIVVDSISKKALSGVSVSFSNNKGTITNEKGYFILRSQLFSLSKKNKLSISYVGYNPIIFNVLASNEVIEINLVPLQKELQEVIIFSKTKSIIERAIERIPFNYPLKPTTINGLLRVNVTINDTDYFYKSDAMIQVYAQSYKNGVPQEVKVLQNKTTTVKNPRSKYYHLAPAIIGGNFSTISDVVYNRDLFLNKKSIDDYLYIQRNKIRLNNHVTYVIDFEKKRNNKMEGTVYIDSSSLAFVAFNVKSYQVKSKVFITKDFVRADIKYQSLGDKWFINSSYLETIYDKSLIAKEYVGFSSITYDTSDIRKISTFEGVKSYDLDDNIRKFVPDILWSKNDSLFVRAENENKLSVVEIPSIDSTIKPRKSLQAAVASYLNNQNISIRIYGAKFPFSLVNTSYDGWAGYSIGTGIMLRINKSFYFQFNAENSWGLGGLDTRNLNYLISFQPKLFSKSARSLVPALHAGFSSIRISEKESNIHQRFTNAVTGLSFYVPVSKRVQLFTEAEYILKLKNHPVTLSIMPISYSFKAGINLKL